MAELPLPAHLIKERFVRASGPGGQNVNKVATAVELRVDIAKSTLADEVKRRLADLAGTRMTKDGILVIDAHEHRTQAQNRAAARERLVDLVGRARRRPRVRRATKPTTAERERRLAAKKHRSATKWKRARPSDE